MSGIKFGEANGKAASNGSYYKYQDGTNQVRLFGDLLPRYVYYIKDANGKNHTMECLAFDRAKERFTNAEADHVQANFPDEKCSWGYMIKCIDRSDGKVKLMQLKKKLFEQIRELMDDLGDPTDVDTGWDVVFNKKKTGPSNFNVEYTLQALKCKKGPLSEADKEMVAAEESIGKFPRPSASEQLKYIEQNILSVKGKDSEAEEAAAEFKDDDIPF